MIKYKNQPDIDIEEVVVIRKDQALKKELPYAIMFYCDKLDYSGLSVEVWKFKTQKGRDAAYDYVCNHKIIQNEFGMSPVRMSPVRMSPFKR